MTKKLLVMLAAAVLLLAVSGTAMAQGSVAFVTNLTDTAQQADPVYLRYFTADKERFGPNDCGGGFDGIYCVGTFKSKNNGYKGDAADIFNFGVPEGTVMHGVWDMETGAGTGNHTGYFAWSCDTVESGTSHTWFDPNCAGTTTAADCLGNGNTANAEARTNTPQGTILAVGGLGVVPVPTVGGVNGTVVSLNWDAVTGGNCAAAATYELYYHVADLSGGSCPAPTDAGFTALGAAVAGTTMDVDVSIDLGGDSFGIGEAKGVVFALRLNYGKNLGPAATSRYLSANGQCVTFDTALAAEIYDIQVRYAGRTNAEVSWKSSLEDGVRGFYVTRATTLDGPFTRVSDFIVANGEPSAYSFIDTITAPTGRVRVSGLYYQIESVDIDDNIQVFGPAALELPTQRPGRVPSQERPMRRR